MTNSQFSLVRTNPNPKYFCHDNYALRHRQPVNHLKMLATPPPPPPSSSSSSFVRLFITARNKTKFVTFPPKLEALPLNKTIPSDFNSILPASGLFNQFSVILRNIAVPLAAITMMIALYGCNFALALSGGRAGGGGGGGGGGGRGGRSDRRWDSSSSSSSLEAEGKEPGFENGVRDISKAESLGFFGFFFLIIFTSFILGITKNVYKLQVLVYDNTVGTFRKDLNQIARKADTSTVAGLRKLLSDVASLLLQHFDSCISGYTCVDKGTFKHTAMNIMWELSSEEHEKFDEETLINLNSKIKEKDSIKIDTELCYGYTVVTILVCTHEFYTWPTINELEDLKEALKVLKSSHFGRLKDEALEVLWAPQQENESITEKELHEKYPVLRSI